MASKVMKKAWEIFKKAGVRTMEAWSRALRQAWAIVKGVMKELIGTEKQITWAEKIRQKMLEGAKEELARRQEFIQKRIENGQAVPEEKRQKYLGEIESVIALIENQTQATWFIDRRDYSWAGLVGEMK